MSSSASLSIEVRYSLIAVSSRSSTVSMHTVSETRLRSPRLNASSAPRSMASNTSTMRSASRGTGERDAGGLAGRSVEIDRPRRIGRVDARRQETRQQSGERFQKREEQLRQRDTEA